MSNKPIQWEIVASMEGVQKEHPDWTEEQCREEFNRRGQAAFQKLLDEDKARRAKRRRKKS